MSCWLSTKRSERRWPYLLRNKNDFALPLYTTTPILLGVQLTPEPGEVELTYGEFEGAFWNFFPGNGAINSRQMLLCPSLQSRRRSSRPAGQALSPTSPGVLPGCPQFYYG